MTGRKGMCTGRSSVIKYRSNCVFCVQLLIWDVPICCQTYLSKINFFEYPNEIVPWFFEICLLNKEKISWLHFLCKFLFHLINTCGIRNVFHIKHFPLSRYILLKSKNSSSLFWKTNALQRKAGTSLGMEIQPPSLVIIITMKLRVFQAKIWEKE